MVRLSAILMLTICLSFACSSFASSPSSFVLYDQQHNLLDIKTSGSSLLDLCSRIAEATGVIIDVAPGAEQQISFSSSQKNVKKTLQDLVTSVHLSHMFVYATKNGETRLYQVKILPRSSGSDASQSKQMTMTTEERRKFLTKLREERQQKLDQKMPKLSNATRPKIDNPTLPSLPPHPAMPNEQYGLKLPGESSRNGSIDQINQPRYKQGGNE